MRQLIYRVYIAIFAKKRFVRFNRFVVTLGLKGLGINNYESNKRSGEYFFIKKWIKNKFTNPIIFDIGANIGNYSTLINYDSQVYAFEPVPSTFKKLEKKLADKHNFKTFNFGFSNNNGSVEIFDGSRDGSSQATLFKERWANETSYTTEIEVKTLDEFCLTQGIERIDLLKIDTEGNEYNILLGARSMLSENKISVIHFEYGLYPVYTKKILKDFMELLPNFEFYRLLPNSLLKIKYDRPEFDEL